MPIHISEHRFGSNMLFAFVRTTNPSMPGCLLVPQAAMCPNWDVPPKKMHCTHLEEGQAASTGAWHTGRRIAELCDGVHDSSAEPSAACTLAGGWHTTKADYTCKPLNGDTKQFRAWAYAATIYFATPHSLHFNHEDAAVPPPSTHHFNPLSNARYSITFTSGSKHMSPVPGEIPLTSDKWQCSYGLCVLPLCVMEEAQGVQCTGMTLYIAGDNEPRMGVTYWLLHPLQRCAPYPLYTCSAPTKLYP